MAKKTNSTKSDFRSILTDIRKGDFVPVYLLMGEEPYYIDRLVEELERNVVKEEEDREFNFTTIYGQDADMASVIATCQQYPFMSDKRIVFLKEAQSMQRAKAVLDELAPYVNNPNPQCVLVVVFKGDVLNATSALMKTASGSDKCIVYKSNKLRDYELTAPITEYCREKKIAIGEDASQLLAEYIGNNLLALFGAIDKLILAGASKTGRITPELIAGNLKISKEFNNFNLQSALAVKDYNKCLRIIGSFRSDPKNNPVTVTIGMLFAFYSKLLMLQMSGERTESGLMSVIGSKSSYAFRDYKEAMRKYTIANTVNAIHLLRELDVKSKGVESFQDEFSLLTECIFNIFTGYGPKF